MGCKLAKPGIASWREGQICFEAKMKKADSCYQNSLSRWLGRVIFFRLSKAGCFAQDAQPQDFRKLISSDEMHSQARIVGCDHCSEFLFGFRELLTKEEVT